MDEDLKNIKHGTANNQSEMNVSSDIPIDTGIGESLNGIEPIKTTQETEEGISLKAKFHNLSGFISKNFSSAKDVWCLNIWPSLRNSKPKLITSIVVLLFLFLVIFMNTAPGNKVKLNFYGATKNSAALTNYVEKNKNKNKKEYLVDYAVDVILNKNLESGIIYLNKQMLNENNPKYLIYKIASSFNVNKIKYLYPADLVNYYIKNNEKIDVTFKNNLEDLMRLCKQEEIEGAFSKYIDNLYNGKKITEGIKITNLYKALNIIYFEDITKLNAPITVLCDTWLDMNTDIKYDNDIIALIKKHSKEEIDTGFTNSVLNYYKKCEYTDCQTLLKLYIENKCGSNNNLNETNKLINSRLKLMDDVNNNNSKISIIDGEISSNNDSINNALSDKNTSNTNLKNLKDTFNSYEDDYTNKNDNIITMEFYCTGEYSDKYYEIAMPEYNYYGKIPSQKDRAVLYTNDTTITSKGWCVMDVYAEGTESVKLKDDYGGFTQTWPKYVEVSSADREEIKTIKNNIDSTNSEIKEVNKKISNLNSSIKGFNNKNSKLGKDKSTLLNQIKKIQENEVNIDKQVMKLISANEVITTNKTTAAEIPNNNLPTIKMVNIKKSDNYSINYPQITIANKEVENKINKLLNVTLNKDASLGYNKFICKSEVKYVTKDILSVLFSYDTYGQGAAHDQIYARSVNVSLIDGRELKFEDFFTGKDDYLTILTESATEYFKANYIEIPREFNKINGDEKFYLTLKYFVVYYDPFEIASFGDGSFFVKFGKELTNGNW